VGRRAVFTIVQNEPTFLALWLAYYGRYFAPDDIWILDHDSTDGSTGAVAGRCHVVPVHRDKSFDHAWLRDTAQAFQAFLLRSYAWVLFAEADEFVVADPARFAGLDAYIDALAAPAVRCTGFNVVHQPAAEPPIDFTRPLLAQRGYWRRSTLYSKRILSSVPLAWQPGFHEERALGASVPDPALALVHLHRVDYQHCLARHRERVERRWNERDVELGHGYQSRIVEPADFDAWFFGGADLEPADTVLEPIPDRLRAVL
jgi:hypothetical protein